MRLRAVEAGSEELTAIPGTGANVRQLDHLNLLAADVRALRLFFEDVFGMRTTEMIVLDNRTKRARG
jgi:catechol 2,3-dioxygenase